jgi:hypothetical protein
MNGSYVALRHYTVVQPINPGVDPMTGLNLVGYLSFWMLLVLAWKPLFYVVMYFYGLARKNTEVQMRYGNNLHAWISSLWNLVL